MMILLIATNVRRKWNTAELLTIALNVLKMKTKEEIEELAEKKFNGKYYPISRQGFIDGYIQCQQNMADIIKKAIEYGYQLRCNHKPINSGIDWVKEFNSLNKQD